ncbi:hypothetical protein [Paenibacillus qinlingensis]|uniref:Uncharacterized protein n=1 Tax=Paenibacillus qinlingensis TaxID=1837343 RepID=A0ABU1NRK2_9BACL|nr:hypothetical protein [Paenibacillus qinlingensis]MDR6550073.1 hypothetical protein [Paenibacillus qinlingensis]
MRVTNKVKFRPYAAGHTAYPITIVTPEDGYYIHTFFDVSPWSPSGNLLACLKLPFQDRLPGPDDAATVCIIHLGEQTITEIADTKGWGMQVGAHLCWGSDNRLYFNDKEGCDVFAVEYSLDTGTTRRMAGPVYQIAPDGSYLLSPSLSLINASQNGYGATMPVDCDCTPPIGAPHDEGLWLVDVKSNTKRLLFSLQQAYELLPNKKPFEGARFTFFHTKINRQQDRIMQVVRCLFDHGQPQKKFIVTMAPDGSDAKIALPYEMWLEGSHHPDWHPNGTDILMNINLKELRFCQFDSAGEKFQIIAPQVRGGGHPSFSHHGSYIVTDAYTGEPFTNEAHQVPIRLIRTSTGEEEAICWIWTLGGTSIPAELRCDPHPVWRNDFKYVCFNGTPEGKRQILIADLSSLAEEIRGPWKS